MQQIKEIILGGGISGMLWGYFNPESVIITDKWSNQFSGRFSFGPKYLHVDEYSTRLLEELGADVMSRTVKIGYYYDGKLTDVNSDENKKRYFDKTRKSKGVPYESVMSGNKNTFDSFEVNIDELVFKQIKNKVILGRVIHIDIINKILKVQLTENVIEEYQYESLISTLPKNIFLFLCDKEKIAKKFISHSTTFVLNKDLSNSPVKDFDKYDYVYFSEAKYPFHRVTKTDKGYVFEYKGNAAFKNDSELDRETLKVGQLVENDINVEFEGVKFWGRYATWKHSLLINTLLKELYGNPKKDI